MASQWLIDMAHEALAYMDRGEAGAQAVREAAVEREHERLRNPAKERHTKETAPERDRRRYQMCIDAGLVITMNQYANLPNGIGALALREGITKQAFSKSVKAHIGRNRA